MQRIKSICDRSQASCAREQRRRCHQIRRTWACRRRLRTRCSWPGVRRGPTALPSQATRLTWRAPTLCPPNPNPVPPLHRCPHPLDGICKKLTAILDVFAPSGLSHVSPSHKADLLAKTQPYHNAWVIWGTKFRSKGLGTDQI